MLSFSAMSEEGEMLLRHQYCTIAFQKILCLKSIHQAFSKKKYNNQEKMLIAIAVKM